MLHKLFLWYKRDVEQDAARLRRERARQRGSAGKTMHDELEFNEVDATAVPGRIHIDVQTDQYLEELSDKVPEFDVSTQTDYFLDQPTVPIFVPIKTGVDVSTQIEDDLFDFDFECEPILDVLIGKTMEQAMLEVLEEEEIKNIRQHRDEMQQIRNAELAEVQQVEQAEMRRAEEKDNRNAQERARKQREREVSDKVAATAFAHDYLKTLISSVQHSLTQGGFFTDPRGVEITAHFIPWLNDRVAENIQRKEVARALVADVVRAGYEKGRLRHLALVAAITHAHAIEEDDEELMKEQQQKEEELKQMAVEEEIERALMKKEERAKKVEEEKIIKMQEEQERKEAARIAKEERKRLEAEGAEEQAVEEGGEPADE
ncbi:MAG: putative Flagellar radial spoke protein 3 [Streblomastix strix]|uniref:Putative Flagellar radial spoke protein 3 n=1 Tax=Streblomastix strix TaxID=222440 RepID=A0A5J4USJ4_9EUKA|nr:MAG: putative Flagellar radial spoke protein 3 [Streblomastix strix]